MKIKVRDQTIPRRRFAWFPRKINDDMWVWLEPYEERLVPATTPPNTFRVPMLYRKCAHGEGLVDLPISE